MVRVPDTALIALIDEFLRLHSEADLAKRRLDLAKARLIVALRDGPGTYQVATGGVRVSTFRSARFDEMRVKSALNDAGELPRLAGVSAMKVRKAFDMDPVVTRALEGLVERVDRPYVAVLTNRPFVR